MDKTSTILLNKEVIELLKKAKDTPNETYNQLLKKMAKLILKLKERNQYDEFLHKIQQPKMKEIWGSREDEFWDGA